jgi:hypothetical protein
MVRHVTFRFFRTFRWQLRRRFAVMCALHVFIRLTILSAITRPKHCRTSRPLICKMRYIEHVYHSLHLDRECPMFGGIGEHEKSGVSHLWKTHFPQGSKAVGASGLDQEGGQPQRRQPRHPVQANRPLSLSGQLSAHIS